MAGNPESDDVMEAQIPKAPPASLRGGYTTVSRDYVFWCLGMLVWALLCVVYFVMTDQGVMIAISLSLGVLSTLMIVLPTILFGGETWHKRLGWITILLSLACVLYLYPALGFIWGVIKRARVGSYSHRPLMTDVVHLILGVLALGLYAWTAFSARRAALLVRRLAKGEYGEMEIKVGELRK